MDAVLMIPADGVVRTYTRSALLASPARTTITIAPDPVYGRTMRYEAVPIALLLKETVLGPEDHVQVRAVDGFSVSIPVRLLRGDDPQAFLAIEPPDAPWPVLPVETQTTSAGPFYLVWAKTRPGLVGSEYWAYRVAMLSVVKSPTARWPQLAVATGVPETSPIRRGLERFVEICMACHRFDGAGEAEMGPDLARPMNPVAYFQPAALKSYLRDPGALRTWPERRMPAFDKADLSDEDIGAIIAWLAYKAEPKP